jgi:hypothetical protein
VAFEQGRFVSILLVEGNPQGDDMTPTTTPATTRIDDFPTSRGPLGLLKLILWAMTATRSDRRRATRM